MKDELHAAHAPLHDGLVGHGADHDFRPHGAQGVAGEPFLVIEGDHGMPLLAQTLHEGRAGEAGAARHKNSHQVAPDPLGVKPHVGVCRRGGL